MKENSPRKDKIKYDSQMKKNNCLVVKIKKNCKKYNLVIKFHLIS